jgi:NTE family protein
MSSETRVGIALSGGGALGAAHIGVLEVLETTGIRPVCITGTSAGSIVGAAYAAGMPVEAIKQEAIEMRWTKIAKVVRPTDGFFDGSRLEEYLIGLIGDPAFDQLQLPFACAACDLLSEEEMILREGRVALAVRASCALPGVFTPVEYKDERLLVDGGLVNNLPVAPLEEMDAEYTIAVDLQGASASPRDRPQGMLEIWLLCFDTMIRNTMREASLADVVISPSLGGRNIFDLSRIPQYIERGREAAEAALPQILRDLGMGDTNGS